jgi:hypothetical protein
MILSAYPLDALTDRLHELTEGRIAFDPIGEHLVVAYPDDPDENLYCVLDATRGPVAMQLVSELLRVASWHQRAADAILARLEREEV